ncbi:hypothetical protein QJU96_00170 [Pasteurella skyensis]|uniref:Uncharacterized protein n=1 Tax=Phocoenobacter skyensis TaxID=97481 RepID=A0AAJ6NE70_9PAST|nr:hypothetical protein [Pasteurella skyensis]MDP8169709.1 hypothetical protein [Pasteurella skyensis]MDP8175122.1 hypothetical protein [Pasteurella skyensis]
MSINDKLELAFYKKEGIEFEKFTVSIYRLDFPDLQLVKPQGQKGDGANDGYISGELILQVYAPEKVDATKAIEKMRRDFERAKNFDWNFNKWYFVINDKFQGLHPDVLQAIEQLRRDNPNYNIKIIRSIDLKDKILSHLRKNKLRVQIILNADKDISEFNHFEKIANVIDVLSQSASIRKVETIEFKNFSEEEFLPDGIEKLKIRL